LNFKTLKLYDFFEEFNDFRTNKSKRDLGCENMSKNLIRTVKNGKIYFKNHKIICPKCKSHKVNEDGYYKRTLHFLHIGEKICLLKTYKCSKCGKKFVTNMKSIVDENKNITKPIINCIQDLYSTFGNSLYKIQYWLKKDYNVNISHQSIENIILSYKNDYNIKNWSYSGYYLFDSLWIKINGQWKYILALFDLKLNTLINYKIVDSEDSKTIYQFINKSTYNQNRYYIVTDLKKEYREVIYKLGFKHQFCKFHTKQKINRDIKLYLKENKINKENELKIKEFKRIIFDMLNSKNMNEANNIRKQLFSKINQFPLFARNLFWKFIVPYFKNLTYFLENNLETSTSNKIENFFQKVFPKHIKKKFRSKLGAEVRFELKIKYWNQNNLKNF